MVLWHQFLEVCNTCIINHFGVNEALLKFLQSFTYDSSGQSYTCTRCAWTSVKCIKMRIGKFHAPSKNSSWFFQVGFYHNVNKTIPDFKHFNRELIFVMSFLFSVPLNYRRVKWKYCLCLHRRVPLENKGIALVYWEQYLTNNGCNTIC